MIKTKDCPFLRQAKKTFTSGDCLYLILEYFPGGSLGDLLSSVGCLVEDVALFYFAEMIMAIQALRNLGFVHRSLAFDSFMINKDGHVKLTSFGNLAPNPPVDTASVVFWSQDRLSKCLHKEKMPYHSEENFHKILQLYAPSTSTSNTDSEQKKKEKGILGGLFKSRNNKKKEEKNGMKLSNESRKEKSDKWPSVRISRESKLKRRSKSMHDSVANSGKKKKFHPLIPY